MSSIAAAWEPWATKSSSADSSSWARRARPGQREPWGTRPSGAGASSWARRALRGNRPPRGRGSWVVVTEAAYSPVTRRPGRDSRSPCSAGFPRWRDGDRDGAAVGIICREHGDGLACSTRERRTRSSRGVFVPLPALVEPAEELTIDEVRRYSRHLIIPDVGMTGQKRLKNAKVLVIGAGGLGSPALLYLAAAGVGTLGIAEFDEVDESNLQRQIIHGQSDVGRPKAESARDSIKEVNPYVDVVVHGERLESDNAVDLFREYDLIL